MATSDFFTVSHSYILLPNSTPNTKLIYANQLTSSSGIIEVH